jgi:hypothetical protein
MIAAVLPWSSPPTQVNVWRGAHVWHVANTSPSSGELKPVIKFEALAGLDYQVLIERQCIRSMRDINASICSPEIWMTVARGPDQAPRTTA